MLERAVTADPSHAPSHAALASAWSALGYDAKAREHAQKAFELSSNLSRQEKLSIEAGYRELLRAELAQSVADPAEVDDEIRHLFAALGG